MNAEMLKDSKLVEPHRYSERQDALIRWLTGALAFTLVCSAAAARAAPIRIVVYGDSGVAGRGVDTTEIYPVQLHAMLRQKGYDAVVINEGGNGRTSSDAIANLGAAISSRTDIVIVQFGVNDIKKGVDVARVRTNMNEVISRLKARGFEVLVVGYPSADLSGVAAAHGMPYVVWGGLPDPKYHVPNDPNHHFNAAGLRIMAARMLPALEKLIAQTGKHQINGQ